MAQALILGSEPLNALANATRRSVLALRARAILQVAHEEKALVRVPAPVLAEVCRGSRRDAAVHRILNGRGIEVVSLTATMARRAGALLSATRLGSSGHAIDAFVVATAAEFGEALIATHDPRDIERLAAKVPGVRVFSV